MTRSSKRTLALKLLARQYDVSAGRVMIDGFDVRDLTVKSLRDALAVVPQDTVMFSGTILQNIAYGQPDATREEVIKVAKMAQLHDDVM